MYIIVEGNGFVQSQRGERVDSRTVSALIYLGERLRENYAVFFNN